MSDQNGSSSANITAKYVSPNESKVFTYAVPAPGGQSVAAKVDSLAQTRSSVKKLQEDINVFLTAKMEQDKAAQGGGAVSKVKDEEEEANYGEEVVEED